MYPNIEKVYIEMQKAWLKQGLPSTLLIKGKLGVGKKYLALKLAQLISCEKSVSRLEHSVEEKSAAIEVPCGRCFSCRQFQWEQKDVSTEDGRRQVMVDWLTPLEGTSAELAKLEARRDRIQENVQGILKNPFALKPWSDQAKHRVEAARDLMKELQGGSDRYRVVIIPDAERMDAPVANALLKILEEAPERVWFILTTSHPERLLKTIISRSLQIALTPLGLSDFAQAMVTQGQFNPEEMEWLYYFSEGAMGYGLSFDGAEVLACRDFALNLLRQTLEKYPGDVLRFIEQDEGFNQFLNQGNLGVFWRMLALIFDQVMRDQFAQNPLKFDNEFLTRLGREKLFRMHEHLVEILRMPDTVRPQVRLAKWAMECSLIQEGVL